MSSKSSKKTNSRFDGVDKWINQRTGEVAEMPQVTTSVPRNGFEITYLTAFVDLFDKLGGKKYQVFKYIIEHKDTNNSLIITTRGLASKTNVSVQTVQDTLNLLKEAGLITKKTGAIMLTPKIAHRGSNGKEQYLLRKFEAFDGNSSAKK